MADRYVNIFLIFTLVCILTLSGEPSDYLRVLVAIALAWLLANFSFIMNWLTLGGAGSATVLGTIAYGLGNMTGALVILAFFVSGSLLSRDVIPSESVRGQKFRRDGKQVWSNGFWFACWLIVWFVSGEQIFMIASVSAIAGAAADTWATEIGGNRIKGATRLITNWQKVEPGTDGGISLAGTIATLGGSSIIMLIFYLMAESTAGSYLMIIVVSGVAGSLSDSYFGARLQSRRIALRMITHNNHLYVDNNLVNWLASGVASLTAIILTLIFS